ncbi:MAG: hypothetical protein R3F28_16670 [Candidatus Kapaibacterium sp.]|nr:hypothetical protein [Ignavibacteria bacterium]
MRTYRQKEQQSGQSGGRIVALSTAILLIALCSTIPTKGQGSDRWRIGGFLGWGLIDHQVNMTGLPGVPSCCPEYKGGSGNGLSLGAAVELSLAQHFSLSGRLLYASYSGLLETEEDELVTADRDTVRATFLHSIDESQSGLALETFVTFQPINRVGLFGGVRTDFSLSTNFHQEERILEPSNIRYENNSRIRLVSDGKLPDASSLQLSLQAGIRYDLPLNTTGTMMLVPEVAFWHGLSPVVGERDWQMRGLRFGLELQVISIGRAKSPSPLEPGDRRLIVPIQPEPDTSTGSSSDNND